MVFIARIEGAHSNREASALIETIPTASFLRCRLLREHAGQPALLRFTPHGYSPLRIPAEPLLLGEGRWGGAAGLFEEQHFKIDQPEPGRIGNVMVVTAL